MLSEISPGSLFPVHSAGVVVVVVTVVVVVEPVEEVDPVAVEDRVGEAAVDEAVVVPVEAFVVEAAGVGTAVPEK